MASAELAPRHSPAYGGKGPLILGFLWTELTLATILISLRLYVGVKIRNKLGWDFFWVTITLVSPLTAPIPTTSPIQTNLVHDEGIRNCRHSISDSRGQPWYGQPLGVIATPRR